MSHNHKLRRKKTSLQKLFCTGHVNCENTKRLHVPSVMLIKYSLHEATYIRNLPFCFVLVIFIIIAFIPTRSTPNACYIKINKKQTRQIYATFQLITFDIPVLVQRLSILCTKLYFSLSICMCKPLYVRDGSTVLDTGDLFQFSPQNICDKSCSHLLRSILQFLV